MHRAVAFYRCLGIEFTLHRHGTGPEHYASTTAEYVLEIYPVTELSAASANVRLGFIVRDIDALVDSLQQASVSVVSKPSDSEWGRRAVVRDLDGNSVELLDGTHSYKAPVHTVWVFNGSHATFPSAIFTSQESAERWIASKELDGTLTEYPLDIPVYDQAIAMNWFTPKREDQKQPQFIQSFTSASQVHYHYTQGKRR
jgi:lactoylglutathione lyase